MAAAADCKQLCTPTYTLTQTHTHMHVRALARRCSFGKNIFSRSFLYHLYDSQNIFAHVSAFVGDEYFEALMIGSKQVNAKQTRGRCGSCSESVAFDTVVEWLPIIAWRLHRIYIQGQPRCLQLFSTSCADRQSHQLSTKL